MLKKLRKVMGVAVALSSLLTCSSQILCALKKCSISKVLYEFNEANGELRITGVKNSKIIASSEYARSLGFVACEHKSYPGKKFFTDIKRVIINDGISEIGEAAFRGLASLERVVIPDSVTKIRRNAFSDCISLKGLVVPGSVEKLGRSACSGCINLKTVDMCGISTVIDRYAFQGCINLKNVTLPSRIKTIDIGVFSGCNSLERIKIPGFVRIICSNAFACCKRLKNVTFEIPFVTTVIEGLKSSSAVSNYLRMCYQDFSSADLNKIDAMKSSSEIFSYIEGHGKILSDVDLKVIETLKSPSAVSDYLNFLGEVEPSLSIQTSAFTDCPNLKVIYVPGYAEVDNNAFGKSGTRVVYGDELRHGSETVVKFL